MARRVFHWLGLLTLVGAPLGLILDATAWPRWALMWALAATVFAGCKLVTLWAVRWDRAPWPRLVAYFFAWPGLDAKAFLLAPVPPRPRGAEWLGAMSKTAGGLGLVALAASSDMPSWPRGWLGMVGIVFCLHFGVFHLLSCWWRARGRLALPLQRWPIAATSLADFWGRRWNTAFRDITHAFIFRPFVSRLGPAAAILIVFLVSGLVHDLVISVPAQGGYGLPTLYFLIQGMGLLFERSRLARRIGLGQRWPGRLFALAVAGLPLPLLFHPPFVLEVVTPFLEALRRLGP